MKGMYFREWRFSRKFRNKNFRDREEKRHFHVKQLSRLKKSEGKNTIFYSFSVLPTVAVTIYKAL